MKSFLCRLANCNKNSFKGIIKHADKKDLREFITFVSEVMHKKIPIPKTMIRLIRNNRHVMRHLISPSYSLRSKQKYLVQKGGAGSSLSSISRGLARAAEGAGQVVGQGARNVRMGAAAARNIIATGAGSGMRMRSGVQGLSRRQGDLARRQPVMGIAAQRAVSNADYLSDPSTRQASLRSMTSADEPSVRSFPYNRILSRGETPSFRLSDPSSSLGSSSESFLDNIRHRRAQQLYAQDPDAIITPAVRRRVMRFIPPTPSEREAIRYRRFMRAEFDDPHAGSRRQSLETSTNPEEFASLERRLLYTGEPRSRRSSSGYWNRNIASGDSWHPSESMSYQTPSAIAPMRRNPAGSDRAMTPNERYWQRGMLSSSAGPESSIYPRSTTSEYPRSLSTYPISSHQFSSSTAPPRSIGQGIDNPNYVYDDLPQARIYNDLPQARIYENLYDLPQARRVKFADQIRPKGGWHKFADRAIPIATAGAVGLGVGAALGAGVASMQPRRHVPPVIARQAVKPQYDPLPPEPPPKRRKEQEIDYGQWLPYYTSHSRYSAPEYFPRY